MTTKHLFLAFITIIGTTYLSSENAAAQETGIVLQIDSVRNTASFENLTVFFSVTNHTEAAVAIAAPRKSSNSRNAPEFFSYELNHCSCEFPFSDPLPSVKRLDDFTTIAPGESAAFTLMPYPFDEMYCEADGPDPVSIQITYTPVPEAGWKARYINNLKYYGHGEEAEEITKLISLLPQSKLMSNTFEFTLTSNN